MVVQWRQWEKRGFTLWHLDKGSNMKGRNLEVSTINWAFCHGEWVKFFYLDRFQNLQKNSGILRRLFLLPIWIPWPIQHAVIAKRFTNLEWKETLNNWNHFTCSIERIWTHLFEYLILRLEVKDLFTLVLGWWGCEWDLIQFSRRCKHKKLKKCIPSFAFSFYLFCQEYH